MRPASSVRAVLVLIPLLVVGCDSNFEPEPDPLVFVDNPESIQAGYPRDVRVEIANPSRSPLTMTSLGYCLVRVEAPCSPESMEAIDIVPEGSTTHLMLPVQMGAAEAGFITDNAVLTVCLDARAALHCSTPVNVEIRPNPAALCANEPLPIDVAYDLDDPALRCGAGVDAARVIVADLQSDNAYAVRYLSESGEHLGGSVYIYDANGFQVGVTSLPDVGDGFRPPAFERYWIFIDDAIQAAVTDIAVETIDT